LLITHDDHLQFPARLLRQSHARAREDIAADTLYHKQLAHGGVFKLPIHDKDGAW
jgi:hypothetical protein